jgi:hypothetical protein
VKGVVTRGQWGALEASRAPLEAARVEELVVHYTSMLGDTVANHSDCAARVRGIDRFHRVTKGWPGGIGYSWVYCQHGFVFEGRSWGFWPAATLGHNHRTQAICFLGGDAKDRDDVTALGRAATSWLISEFHGRYGKDKRIVGHRDRVKTTCPGDEIYDWIIAEGWRERQPAVKPWPVPLPPWWWLWARWFLGEGEFKQVGPRHAPSRPTRRRPGDITMAPAKIPEWAWARMTAHLIARRT